MNDDEQIIKKGSLVQSRKLGWQGIVKSISSNLWESGQCEETIGEYMAMQNPAITEEQASERWIFASDFAFMDFTAPESDLFVIPASKILFKASPCAFVGHVTHVERQDKDVLLTMITNLSLGTTCKGYKDALVIEEATVVPVVGDAICGTQDFVIISADGLDYPYTMMHSLLTQDWNLPQLPPIVGLQRDKHRTKKLMRIVVPEDLDANGLESGAHYDPDFSFREEQINAARLVIRQHFKRNQGIQRSTGSYGLKHIVEKELGCHLSNGELIVAMIGEGYTFQRDGINCYFNVSLASVNKLRKSNVNQHTSVK